MTELDRSYIGQALTDVVFEAGHPLEPSTPHHAPKAKKKRQQASEAAVKEKKRIRQRPGSDLGVGLQSSEANELVIPQKKIRKKSSKGGKNPSSIHHEEASTFPNDLLFPHMAQPIDLSSEGASRSVGTPFFPGIVADAAEPPSTQPDASQSFLPQTQFSTHPQGFFLPYFHHAHQNSSFAQPLQGSFPQLGEALPDFAYETNEDILRAIQGLDLSKIANVLKTLGSAAAASDPSLSEALPPEQAQLSQIGNLPSTSGDILGHANQDSTHPTAKRYLPVVPPTPPADINEEHAQLLANKWLSSAKLAELVKAQGLVYKKGKFSAIEQQQLKAAIEAFRERRQLTDEDINNIIFAKGDKGQDHVFWSEITAALPLRPIVAVYHHVRRTYHPLKQQGKWMPTEDVLLKQAVADLGQQWEKVSARVGRMATDCRDRYRNHIVDRDVRATGPWTKEEEDELVEIVTEMTTKQGKTLDEDVFWGKVSEKMEGKRGRQQCRIKWTDALSKNVKNKGQKTRWSQQDAYILVHKIDSLNVSDDTEIDWKTLPDDGWNLWSAHCLQRRWFTLKKSVKGHEDMTHQEIMDILRVKKAQLPPPPAQMKRKQPTSATFVESDD